MHAIEITVDLNTFHRKKKKKKKEKIKSNIYIYKTREAIIDYLRLSIFTNHRLCQRAMLSNVSQFNRIADPYVFDKFSNSIRSKTIRHNQCSIVYHMRVYIYIYVDYYIIISYKCRNR